MLSVSPSITRDSSQTARVTSFSGLFRAGLLDTLRAAMHNYFLDTRPDTRLNPHLQSPSLALDPAIDPQIPPAFLTLPPELRFTIH